MIERAPLTRTELFDRWIARHSLMYDGAIISPDHPHFAVLRKKLAEDYTKDGTITPDQLDEDGRLIDHFSDNSVIFDAINTTKAEPPTAENFLAGARLLTHIPSKGRDSFQMHFDQLDGPGRADFEELYQSNPNGIAELATHFFELGREGPGPLIQLYKKMINYSHEHEIKHWVIGLRPTKVEEYQRYLGPAMHPLGSNLVAMGDLKKPFTPFVIDVEQLYGRFFANELGERALAASA